MKVTTYIYLFKMLRSNSNTGLHSLTFYKINEIIKLIFHLLYIFKYYKIFSTINSKTAMIMLKY